MDGQSKSNLTNVDHWVRLLFMLIIGLLLAVARMVIWVVAVLQFLIILFTGEGNTNLRNLGQGASKWCLQAFMFLTFNSDQKPFPFADWPEIDPVEEQATTVEAEVIPAEQPAVTSSIDSAGADAKEADNVTPESTDNTDSADSSEDKDKP